MADWNLSNSVLESYIKGFYGHGSYDAKYWFVGMEFGGGGSVAEIVSRIQGWHDRGSKELEDLAGPQGIQGNSRWFQPPYPLQPTWKQIIRIVLSAEGQPTTTDQLRAYQKDQLGRESGLDCILELLPLPSPGLNRWLFYPDSGLTYLQNRDTYTNHVAPMRIAHLREKIDKHHPATVVFYGSGYEHWWRAIAGTEFKRCSIEKVLVARTEHTVFVITQHPTAFGLGNTYFEAIGQLVKTI